MYSSARFGKRKGEGEGAGCADTRQCNLKSHSESELVSGKPFGDYLGHGDSCNFASCAVDGKSERSPKHLCVVCAYSERKGDGAVKCVAYCPPFDKCAAKH